MAEPVDTDASSRSRTGRRDWLELSALMVMWGWSFAFTKIAVAEVAPTWITAARMVLGAAVLLCVLAWRREALTLTPAAIASYVWLALTGNVVPFILIAWGSQFIPSALAGMIMGAVPLMVMVMAAAVLADEPLTARKALGFFFGFAGVVLLMGPSALLGFETEGTRMLALLAIVAAGAGYATHAVSVRLLPPLPGTVRATGVLLAGAVLSVPLALSLDGVPVAWPGLHAAASIAILGLTTTALALLVLFSLIRAAGANFAAMSNYLVPVFALVIGVVFLGERFAPIDLAGLALVLVGVAIAGSRRRGPAG